MTTAIKIEDVAFSTGMVKLIGWSVILYALAVLQNRP